MPVRAFACLVLALAALAVPGIASAARSEPEDVDAIRRVVEAFRTSIIDHDRAAFMGLFFSGVPGEVTWQFANDDARMARIRKDKPEARKARHLPEVNHVAFIDAIVASRKTSEEVFSNIDIDTDGEIGSVAFDYEFLSDGKQTNWGREMWQLVRTEDGWKIISVIWSIHDPATAG
ncbi:MAG: nuclear transport factor 2 family protein [Pseudoxanthomonas sp.]|nr:nuclear transport factor 2 family protein [Pseudoxanthomonas sp.]